MQKAIEILQNNSLNYFDKEFPPIDVKFSYLIFSLAYLLMKKINRPFGPFINGEDLWILWQVN